MMKSRTCPYCGFKYSRFEYVKKLFSKCIWSKWECPNCKNEITFDNKRRILIAISFGLWMFILNIVKSYFYKTPIMWIIFLVFSLIGSIFIFTYDNFSKTK